MHLFDRSPSASHTTTFEVLTSKPDVLWINHFLSWTYAWTYCNAKKQNSCSPATVWQSIILVENWRVLRLVYNFHILDFNVTFIWEQIIPDHDTGTTGTTTGTPHMFLCGVIFVMHSVVWNCGPEVKVSLISFNLPGQFYIIFLSVLERLVCSFDSYLPLCKLQH